MQFYIVGKDAIACIQRILVTSVQPFSDSILIVQVEQKDHLDVVDVRMIHGKCLCIEISVGF